MPVPPVAVTVIEPFVCPGAEVLLTVPLIVTGFVEQGPEGGVVPPLPPLLQL